MKRIFVMVGLVSALLTSLQKQSYGTTDTSVAVPWGNWSDTNTWHSKIVPSNSNCFDTILINTKVYIGSQTSVNLCDSIVFIVEDTLVFRNGFKLDLPAGSAFIVRDSGYVYPEGSGNSNQIFIGGVEYWRSSDGPLFGDVYLDVSYVSISVSHHNGVTSVDWSTASETNNDYFIIEESTDAVSFEVVGRVQGMGNSVQLNTYHFEVPRLLDKTYYYRLIQVDFDGSRETSATFALETNRGQLPGLKIWSERKELNVSIPDFPVAGPIYLDVFDISGIKVINSRRLTSAADHVVDMSGSTAGLYFTLIHSETEVYHSQLHRIW